MDNDDKEILQSYCDGINDFVDGIGLTKVNSTAKLLPPEFYAVGLDKFEPWTPINTLALLKLLNFHLSWNWG
jgi:acyl-homoserine lactone acylase PvdQ